ncbi:MAG: hypothetical protein HY219_02440, partial [Candidatus Staskawiczbacteria bacterium]|nr:hypothetical protein [Candidatus Staskawiczbacteria bacterium]
MAKLNFTPEELTITDKTQLGTNYAETFVFVPARPDEEELGSLFITAEVASNKSRKENAELISEMATVVKNEYYKNTLVTPISALKFSLKRANVFLVNKKTWLAPAVSLKLRVLVSSLKENKLHLARLGEASAFILRQGDLQSITSHANFKNTANLAFENIISGELLASDHIVLATHQIHKIDENELAAKLQEKKLVDHLKKIDSGIKSLALITLYPTKNSPPQNQPAKPSLAFIGGVDQPRPTAPHPRNKFFKGAVLMTILIGTITTIAIVSLKIKNETSQNKKEA